MEVVTGWLAQPSTTGGLDHLGSQQPCIELYSRLLPGITNVTDRARYYSIYPWFAWSYDRRIKSPEAEDFVALFRRADCLLTLITERFARKSGPSHADDGGAMVGRDTLVPALNELEAGRTLRLSKYATREEGAARYFQNRLGGLGQYYLSTLQQLGLLRGDARPWVKYTHERGEVIARLVDEAVPGDLFFKTLQEDEVSVARLDKLSEFAFSRIPESKAEHEFLLDLFFDRKADFGLDGRQRRLSLGLLLSLAAAKSKSDPGLLDSGFVKDALYGQSLGRPGSWPIPPQMRETAAHWRLYCRNELFSIAVQTIFFTSLYLIDAEDAPFSSADEVGKWLADHPAMRKAARRIAGKTWGEAVSESARRLPKVEDWLSKKHEIQLRSQLLDSYNKSDDVEGSLETIAQAIELLAALVSRSDPSASAYSDSLLPEDILAYYPINLENLRSLSASTWRSLPLHELAGWLVSEWGIATHIHVALRKLRSNPRATFRIRPSDLGLLVDPEIPPPAATNPRLKQSLQILRDLGLTKNDLAKKKTSLSALGQSILGGCLDG
jgi:hypothetical protein